MRSSPSSIPSPLKQNLSQSLERDTVYVLEVDIGRWLSHVTDNEQYYVRLYAGDKMLAEVTGVDRPLLRGQYLNTVLTYTSTNNDFLVANADRTLRIMLYGTQYYVFFDNLRLSKKPIYTSPDKTNLASTRDVYFIGNSLTNQLLQGDGLQQLAKSVGETSVFSSFQIRGNTSLTQHLQNPDSNNSFSGYSNWQLSFDHAQYDALVLQPFIGKTLREELASAKELIRKFKANKANENSRILIYATWGNESPSRGTRFMDTWERRDIALDGLFIQSERTYEIFMNEIWKEFPEAEIIPAGHVFYEVLNQVRTNQVTIPGIRTTIDLIEDERNPDTTAGIHVYASGRYLAGITAHAILHQSSPIGLGYTSSYTATSSGDKGLNSAAAASVQAIAWQVIRKMLHQSPSVSNSLHPGAWTEVLIQNPNFEVGPGTSGTSISEVPIPGWYGTGIWNPNEANYNASSQFGNGPQVAFAAAGKVASMAPYTGDSLPKNSLQRPGFLQILSTPLEADHEYEVTIDVGRWLYDPNNIAGQYIIQLSAGDRVLTQAVEGVSNVNCSSGRFTSITLSFTSSSSDIEIGQLLKIRFWANQGYRDFDNVRLRKRAVDAK